MEKPKSGSNMGPEVLPPPYSSLAPSQEYPVGFPVSATAPYPVTPDSERVPHPMSVPIPPPYYYNPMPVGTSGSATTFSHHPAYNPEIYNPGVTVTPMSQQKENCGSTRNLCLRICLIVTMIAVVVIIGIGLAYYIEEVL